MAASAPASEIISTVKLHVLAAALDLVGLGLIVLQALFWVPVGSADGRIVLLTLAAVPIACMVFAVMPRRSGFLPASDVARRSLLVYASLGIPVIVTLLMLLLVWASQSFDDFAGFAVLLAADGGRNLWESVSLRMRKRR